MKTGVVKKVICLVIAAVFIIGISGTAMSDWYYDGTGWRYQNSDGSYPAGTWQQTDNEWYHFDGSGYMQTGWLFDNGAWYYLSVTGAMATGWIFDNGIWYYLTASGAMATGWQFISNDWYYMLGSGAMVTGEQVIDGTVYYFDSEGRWTGNENNGSEQGSADGGNFLNQMLGEPETGGRKVFKVIGTRKQEESEEEKPISGGWQIPADGFEGWAPAQAKEAFEKATQAWVGQDFTIVGYLGSQVVAGTNYMFLCKGTLVLAEPVTELKVVTVYEDLAGNARITSITDFDIGDYSGAQSGFLPEGNLAGGWVIDQDAPVMNLPALVTYAFNEAMEGISGYNPAAYLGSQIVAGTNYCVLCNYLAEYPCLVYIYEPLSGTAEVTNIYFLNQGDYTG